MVKFGLRGKINAENPVDFFFSEFRCDCVYLKGYGVNTFRRSMPGRPWNSTWGKQDGPLPIPHSVFEFGMPDLLHAHFSLCLSRRSGVALATVGEDPDLFCLLSLPHNAEGVFSCCREKSFRRCALYCQSFDHVRSFDLMLVLPASSRYKLLR